MGLGEKRSKDTEITYWGWREMIQQHLIIIKCFYHTDIKSKL